MIYEYIILKNMNLVYQPSKALLSEVFKTLQVMEIKDFSREFAYVLFLFCSVRFHCL